MSKNIVNSGHRSNYYKQLKQKIMSIKVLLGSLMMGAMLMVSCCNGDSCKKESEGHCAKSDSTKCCKGDSTKCEKKEKCAADCQKACCTKEASKCAHADSIACTDACHAAVATDDSTVVEEVVTEEVEEAHGHEGHDH